jgi:PBSX family phage terminase large subunit
MLLQPPGNSLLIGKTERTLTRNVLDPMRERFGARYVSEIDHNGAIRLFGRRCYVVGANDERAIRKIQGISLVYAYGDEFATWPESFFNMLKSRLRTPGAKFDGTCNPEGPYHWAKTSLLDRAGDLDLFSRHFVLDDNPFLDTSYVMALKTEYVGMWYKRYILGLWVAAEGAVYDMFDESSHAIDSLPVNDDGYPALVRYWVGVDYGTTNPTVFLLVGQDAAGKLYVCDEWRYDSAEHGGRQKTDQEYSAAFRDWIASHAVLPKFVFIDPSAASFIAQLRRDGVRNLASADNSVGDGIRRVATLFSSGRLLIHKRCKGLIREISGYVWDAKAQAYGEDTPCKQADHGPDALRYVINGTVNAWANRRC